MEYKSGILSCLYFRLLEKFLCHIFPVHLWTNDFQKQNVLRADISSTLGVVKSGEAKSLSPSPTVNQSKKFHDNIQNLIEWWGTARVHWFNGTGVSNRKLFLNPESSSWIDSDGSNTAKRPMYTHILECFDHHSILRSTCRTELRPSKFFQSFNIHIYLSLRLSLCISIWMFKRVLHSFYDYKFVVNIDLIH